MIIDLRVIDLTGQRFGKLTVKERDTTRNGVVWMCKCDCGKTVSVFSGNLRKGLTRSCGCFRSESIKERRSSNLTGQRFGKLIVTQKQKNGKWLCECDCGNKIDVSTSNLVTNHTRSCGCLRDEKRVETHTTHGGSKERLHRIWRGMKDRCTNPHNKEYHRYGGRGISVCNEWLRDYSTFRAWALSHGYAENLAIDRIDNDGNYSPDNCQWLTVSENSKKRHGWIVP